MKKMSLFILLFLINITSILAYRNDFYIELNDNETYNTESAKVSESYSDELEHTIALYGTSVNDLNNFAITLQRKSLFTWGNSSYIIYATTDYNQQLATSFGTFANGTFRLHFDTKNYGYGGKYYGNISHFAF